MAIQSLTVKKISVLNGGVELQARLMHFELAPEGAVPTDINLACQMAGNVSGLIGVILSGRGPVWIFGGLVHHAHATPWVVTLDPLLGAVVVESHCTYVQVGDVLVMPE